MNQRNIALAGIVIVVLLGFIIYTSVTNVTHFKVVSHDPSGRAPQSTAVVLNFNKTIGTATLGTIALSPNNIKYTTLIKDKTLYIYPQNLFAIGQEYTLAVAAYQSTGGKVMDPFSMKFKIDANLKATSSAQIDAQVLATDSEQRNPLINKLPRDAVTYKITAVTTGGDVGDDKTWKDFKNNYFIRIQTYAYKGLPPDRYRANTLRFRNDALSWLRDQGVDPDKDIRIFYEPDDQALGTTKSPSTANE